MDTTIEDVLSIGCHYQKNMPHMNYKNLWTMWLNDKEKVLQYKDLFEKEYIVKLLMESSEEPGMKLVNLCAANNCCPRIAFNIIESLDPSMTNRKWLIIPTSIKVMDKLKQLFIPNEAIGIIQEFLSEVMQEYTEQFINFMNVKNFVVKMGFDRMLKICKEEYCNYLKYKNSYRKITISQMQRPSSKHHCTKKTFEKIQKKFEYLKKNNAIEEYFTKDGDLITQIKKK